MPLHHGVMSTATLTRPTVSQLFDLPLTGRITVAWRLVRRQRWTSALATEVPDRLETIDLAQHRALRGLW